MRDENLSSRSGEIELILRKAGMDIGMIETDEDGPEEEYYVPGPALLKLLKFPESPERKRKEEVE